MENKGRKIYVDASIKRTFKIEMHFYVLEILAGVIKMIKLVYLWHVREIFL